MPVQPRPSAPPAPAARAVPAGVPPGCACPPRSPPGKCPRQSALQREGRGGATGQLRCRLRRQRAWAGRSGAGRGQPSTAMAQPQPRRSSQLPSQACCLRLQPLLACDGADVAPRRGVAAAGAQPGGRHHARALARLRRPGDAVAAAAAPACAGISVAAGWGCSRGRCVRCDSWHRRSSGGSLRSLLHRRCCCHCRSLATILSAGHRLAHTTLLLLLLLPPVHQALHKSGLEPIAGQLQALALCPQVCHCQLADRSLGELAARRYQAGELRGCLVHGSSSTAWAEVAAAAAARRGGRPPGGGGPAETAAPSGIVFALSGWAARARRQSAGSATQANAELRTSPASSCLS